MKKIKSEIGSILNKTLSFFGLHVKRADSGFWDFDPEFLQIYNKIKDKTLVKIDRAYMIYQFAKSSALLVEGDIAQVGVYKGGTAKMIAECFSNSRKKFYLFDTFDGLPDASEKDGIKNNEKKQFADVSLGEVKSYLSDYPNTEFKKGFFPHTAKGLEGKQFCFVYLDADLYESTKDGLNFFYPRMLPGGVILLDDYGTGTWPGVGKAVREFCAENEIYPIKTAWWQGLIIKGNKK